MKTATGKQSKSQKDYAREVERYHNKYIVCHSIEEFQQAVIEYLEK
jgi:translation initiation factor 2 beta subunit (eIF-2beta)/eIF-5